MTTDPTEVPADAAGKGDRLQEFSVRDWLAARSTFPEQNVVIERPSVRSLQESEDRFRATFDLAPIAWALIALDGRFEQVNRAMCELTGYSQEQLRTMTVADVTSPEDMLANEAAAAPLVSGEQQVQLLEKRYVKANGVALWLAISVSMLRAEDGSPVSFIAQLQDISERKEHEEALAIERRRLRAAQSIGHIGSWEMDMTTGEAMWSDTLFEMYGLDPADSRSILEGSMTCVHPDDLDKVISTLQACATDGIPFSNRYRIFRANDRELRWFDTHGARYQEGSSVRIAGAVLDVTQQVLAEARLEHAALHDTLTGLPNRKLIFDRLGLALDRSERAGKVAVLFCDLDGFKRINDLQGHHVGDAVLSEAAARMVAAARSGDTVGRMGGDEFVIICSVPEDSDPGALGELIARRIELAMATAITVDGVEHSVSMSIGISLAEQGDNAGTVLRNADVAMYQAKTNGRNGHASFDASLRAVALGRDHTERLIRRALDQDLVEVYYQPIVELSSLRVRSVEALMRVPDGAGAFLDATHVVMVAEPTALLSALDARVLNLACRQAASWRTLPGHGELRININRSAAAIARPGFYQRIHEALIASGLDPSALTIEITETVLLDAAAGSISDLEQLRSEGIGIALDDFGTGYASLHYLATLPLTCLKVDGSFTAGLPNDPTCTTIVCATVGLAADLGIGCIVEGVETIEQLEALPATPGLCLQGFLFGRPQPPRDELPTHLQARPRTN